MGAWLFFPGSSCAPWCQALDSLPSLPHPPMVLRCLLNIWRARELSGDFCPVPREASAGDLQPLYSFVRDALEPVDGGEAAWRCPVLLVDDLSVLLSLGAGPVAVLDFVHYCRATVCWEWKVIRGCTPSSCREPHGPACWQLALLSDGSGLFLYSGSPRNLHSMQSALCYLPLLKSKTLKSEGCLALSVMGLATWGTASVPALPHGSIALSVF